MRLAFAIVSLFPEGGLQRDCLGIARLVRARGHDVTVFTTRHEARIDDIAIERVTCDAWTNHGRNLQFATKFRELARGRFDRLVGFNKLLDVDVLYCADPSVGFRLTARPYLRLLPRYRALSRLEANAFGPGATTKLLLLSRQQVSEYRQAWNTETRRMFLVPPTISTACRQPAYREDGTREKMRAALSIDDANWVWLAICVQPNTKGLDRVIDALAAFPNARLVVVGVGAAAKRAAPFVRRASNLGVSDRVNWLGYRTDIPELMAAADLFVHPARNDTTGTVILEAVINGLPIVTTAVCGYASHVEAAAAGLVVADPFNADEFRAALAQANNPVTRQQWSVAGVRYGAQNDLYQGWTHAADLIIEQM